MRALVLTALLTVAPAALPRRGFVYKGQKAKISYSILLPVSQQ